MAEEYMNFVTVNAAQAAIPLTVIKNTLPEILALSQYKRQ
jgi:hypothetical protein